MKASNLETTMTLGGIPGAVSWKTFKTMIFFCL